MSGCESFDSEALVDRARNLDIAFHWIGESDQFWFKRQRRGGDEFVIVDATTGRQTIVFSADTMRAALNAACPGIVTSSELHITDLRLGGGGCIVGRVPSATFSCKIPVTECEVHIEVPPRPDIVISPDGRA